MCARSFRGFLLHQNLIPSVYELCYIFQSEESFNYKLLSIVDSRGWLKEIDVVPLKIQKCAFTGCDYRCKIFMSHICLPESRGKSFILQKTYRPKAQTSGPRHEKIRRIRIVNQCTSHSRHYWLHSFPSPATSRPQ